MLEISLFHIVFSNPFSTLCFTKVFAHIMCLSLIMHLLNLIDPIRILNCLKFNFMVRISNWCISLIFQIASRLFRSFLILSTGWIIKSLWFLSIGKIKTSIGIAIKIINRFLINHQSNGFLCFRSMLRWELTALISACFTLISHGKIVIMCRLQCGWLGFNLLINVDYHRVSIETLNTLTR
jgi:hypothetical protein